jgi:hypothetical protein
MKITGKFSFKDGTPIFTATFDEAKPAGLLGSELTYEGRRYKILEVQKFGSPERPEYGLRCEPIAEIKISYPPTDGGYVC